MQASNPGDIVGDLVSVIIPVFNTAAYLRTCLDSVLGQSYPKLEVIAVDDGSTDGSLAILKDIASKDRRVRLLSQENRGQGASRNLAVAESSGDWVCFVDSDDFLHFRYVERMLEAARRGDAELALCGAVHFEDGSGAIVSQSFPATWLPISIDAAGFSAASYPRKEELLKTNAAPWAKLLCARLARTVRFPENLRRFEDNPFAYGVLMRARKIVCIREQLYYYRRRRGSVMGKIASGLEPCAVFEDLMESRRLSLKAFVADPELAGLYARQSSRQLLRYYARLPIGDRIRHKARVRAIVGESNRSADGGKPGYRSLKPMLWRGIRLVAFLAPHGLVKIGKKTIENARRRGES
jgi:glycosyltransferase involved in cell wall biosynthesis